MPTIVRHQKSEIGIEKQIITGIVVSDKVAHEIIPFTDETLFEYDVSKYIFRWVKSYYNTYKEAPKLHIEDIFNSVHGVNLETKEMIGEFLAHLSEEYQKQGINEEYVLAESKKYLRKRHLCNLSEEIKVLALANQTDEAEARMEKYGKVTYLNMNDWVFPLDDKRFINRVFSTKDNDNLIEFGGAMQEIVGPIKRGYLTLLIGPFKSGKTWGLLDIAMAAIINGCNTAYINFEMPDDQIGDRLYTMLNTKPSSPQWLKFPVFDCAKNQADTCSRPERTNSHKKPEEYDPTSRYKICTYCRFNDKDSYTPAIWFDREYMQNTNRASTIQELEMFAAHFGKRKLAIRSYPPDETSTSDIIRDLTGLSLATGWTPDVIITDYLQIMKAEEKGLIGRDKMNAGLLAHKKMAFKFKAAVFSGWQGNRESTEADTLVEKHTSEDIRALAHADIVLTINQTDLEKEIGMTRIGCLENRHIKQSKFKQALLLQNLEVGKFSMDSIIIRRKKSGKKNGNDENGGFKLI